MGAHPPSMDVHPSWRWILGVSVLSVPILLVAVAIAWMLPAIACVILRSPGAAKAASPFGSTPMVLAVPMIAVFGLMMLDAPAWVDVYNRHYGQARAVDGRLVHRDVRVLGRSPGPCGRAFVRRTIVLLGDGVTGEKLHPEGYRWACRSEDMERPTEIGLPVRVELVSTWAGYSVLAIHDGSPPTK